MNRIGKTPEFGIEHDEPGLFISNVEFTPACEEFEQLDKDGEVQGLYMNKQRVEVSLTGEVPHNAGFNFTMGTSLELGNQPPEKLWFGGKTPEGTTCVLKPTPYSRSREAAQEANVTATIYPFKEEQAAPAAS